MNIARKLCTAHNQYVSRSLSRKFRFSAIHFESSQTTQPQIKEEKFDFEDIQVLERVERRKPAIPPFLKDIFLSNFNRNLLEYPEILNKEETADLERRLKIIQTVFEDASKTKEDRRNVLKSSRMFGGPVSLTRNGLAMNHTESLRYLEVIGSDIELGKEISDHWVALRTLRAGLTDEQYAGVIDDLITGERTIALCIKERVPERLTQADFRTFAEMDGQGVWRVTGEKVSGHNNGYQLVLASVEANRLKLFLIHPNMDTVRHDGTFVNFLRTPATPLDLIPEQAAAQHLSVSRLYAATLCRALLARCARVVTRYVRARSLGGKPLAELPTLRVPIGAASLDMYAGGSAEYFTAGILDGHEAPDAELEAAACRNFMANRGVRTMLELTSIPALEAEEECAKLLDEMRRLVNRGETLDSVNSFIALNGIHHAGKMLVDEIKQIRNPVLNPAFMFKKVIADRAQERDDPKLTLLLMEHLHPSLQKPAQQLEYCVLRMRFASETLMARQGSQVAEATLELNRLAEAATYILMMTAALARASRAYCIGLKNAEIEMKLAACFVEKTKDRVKRLILEIDDGEFLNLDRFKLEFGRKILDTDTLLVEHPTARVFW